EIVDMHLSETLFKDTPYQYSYGGKPEEIINLTQEEFVKTHKYCYHPSNSYIFLYGNLEITDYLNDIDKYLQKYEFKVGATYLIKDVNFKVLTVEENQIRQIEIWK
ncbi:insulinase family protein, partial [Streptococcus danieliae]|nr:insulinase family protein [Streptococcus danieliae]